MKKFFSLLDLLLFLERRLSLLKLTVQFFSSFYQTLNIKFKQTKIQEILQ